MAADEAFVTHCLELFAPAGPVGVRRLFGGRGFYLDTLMFAMIAFDTLYLRVDDQTRPVFEAAGGTPFVYAGANPKAKKMPVTMPYFTVPLEAMDDPDEMAPWARLAVEAARRAHAAKKPKRPRAAAKTSTARRTSP